MTIPEPETIVPRVGVEPAPGAPRIEVHPVNAMASSAAAKVEMHLKVASDKAHTESLISKPLTPLDAVVKDTDKKIRVKSIRHIDCVEVGHDKFDEKVTAFLQEVTETNLIGIHTISYEIFDVGVQKIMTDYGVLIVYRG